MDGEQIKTEDSVGFKVTKADGTAIEGDSNPNQEPEKVELTLKLTLHKPIKDFLDVRAKKMNLNQEEIYSSLILDAFRMHYNKMCPYCADSKIAWMSERKNEINLAKKLKEMKEKRIKKMQKQARKRNW